MTLKNFSFTFAMDLPSVESRELYLVQYNDLKKRFESDQIEIGFRVVRNQTLPQSVLVFGQRISEDAFEIACEYILSSYHLHPEAIFEGSVTMKFSTQVEKLCSDAVDGGVVVFNFQEGYYKIHWLDELIASLHQ